MPQYELVERIRAEEKKIREEAVRAAALENREIGKKEGIEIGEKKGIILGEKQKAIDMALRMLAKKKDIKEIIEFTGLSKAEIQKLTK